MLYFDYTFYVYLENGEDEQPLLDTNFPDISFQKEGVQIKTYRSGIPGFAELRRLSLWKVVNDFQDDDEGGEQPVDCISIAQKKKLGSSREADAKQSEGRREEDVKSGSPGTDGDAKVSKSAEMQSRKTSLPHHIAPLKATAVSTLKNMPDLGLKAPWDETGRPLGLRTSK